MNETVWERLRDHAPEIIGVGASAGAIDALSRLLPALPASLTVPVLVVVHVPQDWSSGLPALLRGSCALPVTEADDKTAASAGQVYFAPSNYHLLVEDDCSLALSADPPVNFSRPSIDVLFESVAHAFGPRALAILLSGANDDGALGLAAVKARGGLTWVQTPATARVATMPEAALRLAAHDVLDPETMGAMLLRWGTRNHDH